MAELRTQRSQMVFVGASEYDGVCFRKQLKDGQQIASVTFTPEAGSGITEDAGTSTISTTTKTDDTASARFTAAQAIAKATIRVEAETINPVETLVDYIIWSVKEVPV